MPLRLHSFGAAARRGAARPNAASEQNSREFHWPAYREARFVPGSELRVFSVAESAARSPAAAGCGFRAAGGGVRANSTAVPPHCLATRRAATGDATKDRIILVVGLLDTGNAGPPRRESFPACRRKHSSPQTRTLERARKFILGVETCYRVRSLVRCGRFLARREIFPALVSTPSVAAEDLLTLYAREPTRGHRSVRYGPVIQFDGR